MGKKKTIRKSALAFMEAEAYKKLRTNIMLSGSNVRAISVMSAFENEGKSMVSYGLARTLAEAGKKVVFVDADMRNSDFTKTGVFNSDNLGLAHYLIGGAQYEDIIRTVEDNENLFVISHGTYPPNPSELLAQDMFKDLLARLKAEYDYVIIDTPPAVPVVDGVIVSAMVDGVVYLVESGRSASKVEKEVVSQLEMSGCKILGIVLNKFDYSKSASYGTGSYKYKYGYGYGYGYGNNNTEEAKDKKKAQ